MMQLGTKPEHPTDDKRWKMVDSTMRKYGHRQEAMIETLHRVQELFGFLEDDALMYVAKSLRLPPAKVYGVASFYHYFQLKPAGKHTCVVCMGTACYIKGAGDLLKTLEEKKNILPGETTEDKQVSLFASRCVGTCSMAPAVVIDQKIIGNVESDRIVEEFTKLEEE